MATRPVKFILSLFLFLLSFQPSFSHNGSVAYAYPLGEIKVDGNFSDWPSNAVKYTISRELSETKPKDAADFSGFFQVGYRLDNHSLYIAFTITDDNFMEDTSQNVRWNTQDGLEISLDARHLLSGSGVASFMYSKKLRNINNAFYDPFAKNAKWDIMEVALVTNGNTRFYEWRIMLGNELAVGKSLGFDFHVFDRDANGSFSYNAWGKGPSKYINPNSLGDIIPLAADQQLSTISGSVGWEKPVNAKLPGEVRIINLQDKKFWLETELDSAGNYSAAVPPGKYEVMLPDPYFLNSDTVYTTGKKKSQTISVKAGKNATAGPITVPSTPAPDLIPEKGVLLDFSSGKAAEVDRFVETYRDYYGIPGVSLALIKDGRMVYHKTYGVAEYDVRRKSR